MKLMPCYIYSASLMNQNEIRVDLLCERARGSSSNYVTNEHEDFDQYEPCGIPSKIKPCYSPPAHLVNQNEIPADL